MGVLKDTIAAFMSDATPEERAHMLRIAFRIVVAVHIAWACGLLAPMGMNGFVFADEVDVKIKSSLEPIYGQLGAITSQLSESEKIQKRILTGQIATQLRDLNRLRCSTSDDHVRQRMERDIEEAEQEYKALTGERYPLPSCANL